MPLIWPKNYGWKFENIPGNLNLLTLLLTTEETTKEILVVPPKYTTIFSAVDSSMIAVPKSEVGKSAQSLKRFFIHDDNDQDE